MTEYDDETTEQPEGRQDLGEALDDAADEIRETEGEIEDEGEDDLAAADEGTGDDEMEASSDDDEESPLEGLSPEQLAAIKENPETRALYKSLMKSYTKGTQDARQALALVKAFQQNPDAVISQLAQARGFRLSKAEAAAVAEDPDKAVAALEALFGEKLGPRVRRVFDDYLATRTAPLRAGFGRIVARDEQAKMLSEEHAWHERHGDVLTRDVEAEVVALGESGEIVPGPNQNPAGYLDTLLSVVLARRGGRSATERLSRRIARNSRDREPSGTSGRAPIRKVSGVKPTMNLSEAFAAAAAELDLEDRDLR